MTDDLQDLLDRSFDASSAHLQSIMTAERRLDADRLRAELPCPAVLNIATVTARGEPRISAVDGHFVGDHWYFGTALDSPKARQLRARPAISASYTPRDGYGVFCHGRVAEVAGDERAMVRQHFLDVYQFDHEADGPAFFARIDAAWMVAFAADEQDAD